MAGEEHEFGGQHTEIKLELVEKYLHAYMSALRNKFRHLWYIDAFAGTGSRTVRVEARDGDLFDAPAPARTETRRGSARIALDVSPAFDRLIFMDASAEHCTALQGLKAAYPGRNIDILQGDANRLIQDQIKWDGWKSTRAVMFLDPYGMEVEWETLTAIAETRAIDVWYLFSLSGLYRQAARNISSVDDSKRRALTRMLGTDQWEHELYSPVKSAQSLLDGLDPIEVRQRNADVAGLEAYVKRRLETIFPHVFDPFPLPPNSRPQRFSLFGAISSRSTAAINLAKSFGDHILASGRSSHVRSR
jgi:three-Cys-motif partner protein